MGKLIISMAMFNSHGSNPDSFPPILAASARRSHGLQPPGSSSRPMAQVPAAVEPWARHHLHTHHGLHGGIACKAGFYSYVKLPEGKILKDELGVVSQGVVCIAGIAMSSEAMGPLW